MSQDSIAQWDQILKVSFSNNYPAFHTLTNWLVTRIWLSPAAIAIAQIFTLSIVFSLAIDELERWGIASLVRALITLVFCLSPVNGMMVISLWKDIPYTCAMLGLFVILLRVVRTEGLWLRTAPGMVALWGALLAASLFRHNGLAVAGLLLVIMLILWRKVCFRPLVRVGVNWILVFIIITGPIYRILGVVPMAKFFARQNVMHQIGAMMRAGVISSNSDLTFLAAIQPIENWVKFYNCYDLNVLIYNEQVQHRFIESNADQLVDIWQRSVLIRPSVIWKHQKCVTTMLWRITEPEATEGRLYTTELAIIDNDFGLQTRSLWPSLHKVIYDVVTLSHRPSLIWIVWRPAFYLLLLLLFLGFAAIRRKKIDILQIGMPALLNSLVWVPLMTTQDFRFQYPVYVISLIAPALLFVRQRSSQDAGSPVRSPDSAVPADAMSEQQTFRSAGGARALPLH
jgi:hypothetical protein